MDLGSTAAFGADMDGDEMNLLPACSENSKAELQELLSTQAQFISGAESRPMLQVKQDNMIGGYLYTLGRVPVAKSTFMDACCLLETMTTEQITGKMDHIRRVYRWVGLLQEEIERVRTERAELEACLEEARARLCALKIQHTQARDSNRNTRDEIKAQFYQTKAVVRELKERVAVLPHDIEREASDRLLFTGHGLFSMLLPRDFEFSYDTKLSPDKKPLWITRGVFVTGTINNPALHHLIHHLYKNYGGPFGCDFVTYWQRFTNLLLNRQGFSVGLGDCLPKATHIIESELEKAFLQARAVEEGPLDPDQKEAKVLGILNGATNVGERIVREGIDPSNNFLHMITSGSKGKMFNYVNSVSAVGQQNLSGRRVPIDCGGRSLPCYPGPETVVDEEACELDEFERLTRHYQSRGFIRSSFYSGLTSQEFFFLAAGGREGLIDTSVKTATCGYLSKRMLKSMEDVKIGYNQQVTNSRGTVIQFCYGDDNYAAPELIRTEKYGLQCVDVVHLAETLCRDLEWDAYGRM